MHDSIRQVNYLQQCLSQDKRSIGLMVAAGCPVSIRVSNGTATESLIPDVRGLTDVVAQKLRAGRCAIPFEKMLAHLQSDGREVINVETQLGFIRGLKAIAGSGEVRDITVSDLALMEDEICGCIAERVDRDLPEEENPYSQMAAWIGSVTRSSPVEIFTTNYDLLVEQALERYRIPYFDGFSGSKDAFLDSHSMDYDELPSRWARLWKLHGSINWSLNSRRQVYRGGNILKNCIIHPSHLKYDESRRMPYLAMIDRLRSFVRRPSSVLVICGYSFRDEHLNACLLEGLTGSPRSAVFALMFGSMEEYPDAMRLAVTAGNISLLAKDSAIIGTRLAKWSNRVSEDNSIWSGAVEVNSVEGDTTQSVATFHLGDFARLGKFLMALIGREE